MHNAGIDRAQLLPHEPHCVHSSCPQEYQSVIWIPAKRWWCCSIRLSISHGNIPSSGFELTVVLRRPRF